MFGRQLKSAYLELGKNHFKLYQHRQKLAALNRIGLHNDGHAFLLREAIVLRAAKGRALETEIVLNCK